MTEDRPPWRAPDLWFRDPLGDWPRTGWRHPAFGAANMLDMWPLETLAALQHDVRVTLGVSSLEAWLFVLNSGGSSQHPSDAVAETIQESWIDTSWPQCPGHSHPMVTNHEDEFTTWRCMSTREVVARVGELKPPSDA